MASFGNNPSRDNWFFSDGVLDNQAWDSAISVGDVGRITDINAYFGGDTAGCTGGPVLFNSDGSVNQYTAASVGQGSRSANGGFTITTSGLDITFANPTTWTLGGFRNSGDSWVVPFADNVGNYGTLKTVSGSSPAAATGGNSWATESGFNGGITAYANYFAGQVYVRRSGAWTKAQIKVRRAGVWNIPKIYVRRAGAWVQVNMVAQEQELDWITEFKIVIEWAKNVWEYGLFRWTYDQAKTFGRTRSGILLAGEYR